MPISVKITIYWQIPDHKIGYIWIVVFTFQIDLLLWRMLVKSLDFKIMFYKKYNTIYYVLYDSIIPFFMLASVMIKIHRHIPDHKIRYISIVVFTFQSNLLPWSMRVTD